MPAWTLPLLLAPSKELRQFAPYFNPYYCIRRAPPMGDRFTSGEEKLFGLGLRRYGMSSIDMIQAVLLPTKSKGQLENHFHRQTSRNAHPDNPIKRAKLDCHGVAMSSAEEMLLARGVKLHGHDWNRIRSQLLPHRSARELQQCWLRKLRTAEDALRRQQPPAPSVFGGRPTLSEPRGRGRPAAAEASNGAPVTALQLHHGAADGGAFPMHDVFQEQFVQVALA